jgi:hypothetical protein
MDNLLFRRSLDEYVPEPEKTRTKPLVAVAQEANPLYTTVRGQLLALM